ncbi:MAG: helix-turn-helix transcriptional regulator [Demequinaceae bacterium]|nr:helix-turn-helix transcriptional regulator [Demequinaceae bacterium]
MLAANAADIGNIVRRRRTKASLSQGELADKIGVSRKWIADLEKGHPRAQLHLVLDVLNALDALVDVIDAPGAEPAARESGRTTTGLAPKDAVPTDPIRSLDQLVESMTLPTAALPQMGSLNRLIAQREEQLDAHHNALAALADLPFKLGPLDDGDDAS